MVANESGFSASPPGVPRRDEGGEGFSFFGRLHPLRQLGGTSFSRTTHNRFLRLAGFVVLFNLSVEAAPRSEYERKIVPMLQTYCFDCHGDGMKKGDVTLDRWTNEAAALADRKTWERVMQKIQNAEMPPPNKPQPRRKERERLAGWIDQRVMNCDCDHPDPGRVTLRRLNRAEYNNTVRDLLGVDFKPADDFPVDDSGYGFDNIGDALSLPPVLLEKYLAASQKILETVFDFERLLAPHTNRYDVDALEVGYNAKQRGDGWVALNSIEEDDVAVNYEAPAEGEYVLRVRAYARQETTQRMKLTFMLGAQPIRVVEVETNQAVPKLYEARVRAPAGRQRFRAVVRRNKDGMPEAEALKWKAGPPQKGAVLVEHLEIEGPFNVATTPWIERRNCILFRRPEPGRETETTRELVERVARRAFRRPVTDDELDRMVRLAGEARERCANSDASNGPQHCFESGIRLALQAMLVSPHFLFRDELQPEPDNPKATHRINEFALASRLSYFLWSSMPDEELLALAGRGKLRRNLERQVRRMLQDPRARALVDNFAGQWLQIRNVDLATPDPETFPRFDAPLRGALRRETELFFEHIMREDRSVLEFLTADYTFVNDRLRRHYGLPADGDISHRSAGGKATGFGSSAEGWRRISLRGTQRRGVLTHGSVLLITSNPTRTSPVKRGKWVLDNLLNAPPPPPPPNIPELKDGKEATGTLRQRLEQHRADPLCSSCHARMDPIGFGLENFDAIGAWRARDGAAPIEPAGKLATGEAFNGAGELTAMLADQKREQFVRCLADKMLTYAMGRGLEYYDKCALDEICARLPRRGHRFSALVMEIVKSTPFQMRRGDGSSP